MLDCPNCHNETQRTVIRDGKYGCYECLGRPKSKYDPKLHGTFASDGKTRLTNGKAWEIANRIVSPDDHKTLINRVTGKPAQY